MYVLVAQLMKMHRNKFIFIWILSIRYVNVVAHCMALHRETIHNLRCIFQTKTHPLTQRIPGDLIEFMQWNWIHAGNFVLHFLHQSIDKT